MLDLDLKALLPQRFGEPIGRRDPIIIEILVIACSILFPVVARAHPTEPRVHRCSSSPTADALLH